MQLSRRRRIFVSTGILQISGLRCSLRPEQDSGSKNIGILEIYIEYTPGLLIQPEAGIRTLPIAVFPESGIFDENCRYGLSLSYGFQWMPLGNLYVDYQHKVSLGLEIWCDY